MRIKLMAAALLFTTMCVIPSAALQSDPPCPPGIIEHDECKTVCWPDAAQNGKEVCHRVCHD